MYFSLQFIMRSFVACVVLFAAVVIAEIQKPPLPITTLKDLKVVDSRIINGEFAKSGQLPWQVAIQFTDGVDVFFCGGSLIYENWVLTAAHCAQNAVAFVIILGSLKSNPAPTEPGLVLETTTEKYVHEKFNERTLNNDIALIKLKNKVKLSDIIKTIPLADSKDYVEPGISVTVSGWGRTSDTAITISPLLKYTTVKTISNKECASIYGPQAIIQETLCARGNPSESTCNGDSGGPLTTTNSKGEIVHAGIISFVYADGCAAGQPSGYVRTASYRKWISEKTGIGGDEENENGGGNGGGNGGNGGNNIQNIFALNIFFILLLLKQVQF